MSLESRLGVTQRQPDRTIIEHAPQLVRQLLKQHLIEIRGPKGALTLVGALLDVDTSDYNSPTWVSDKLDGLISDLQWLSVYRLLEEESPTRPVELGSYIRRVNEVLAMARVAYKMVNGRLQRLDETGTELDVSGDERRALEVMVVQFRPARDQYLLAVQALNAIPTRPKDAVRESVNALEAVLKIITKRGDASLGEVAADLVRDPAAPWRGSLGAALRSLYGYASQVPGVRHAQHIDAEVTPAEAALVVRMCGAAIVYFIDQHGN